MDIKSIKSQFPIFKNKVNGKPLIYLDNANSSQKPKKMLLIEFLNFIQKNSQTLEEVFTH